MKGGNRKIINIVRKQGELLKRFKDSEGFFDCVGLGRANIQYRKIQLLHLAILRAILRRLKRYVKQIHTYLTRKSKKYLFHSLYLLSLFA